MGRDALDAKATPSRAPFDATPIRSKSGRRQASSFAAWIEAGPRWNLSGRSSSGATLSRMSPESSGIVDPREGLVREYQRAVEELRRDLGDPQTLGTSGGSGGHAVVSGGRRSSSQLEALGGSSLGLPPASRPAPPGAFEPRSPDNRWLAVLRRVRYLGRKVNVRRKGLPRERG
jgi:hypothetical protein